MSCLRTTFLYFDKFCRGVQRLSIDLDRLHYRVVSIWYEVAFQVALTEPSLTTSLLSSHCKDAALKWANPNSFGRCCNKSNFTSKSRAVIGSLRPREYPTQISYWKYIPSSEKANTLLSISPRPSIYLNGNTLQKCGIYIWCGIATRVTVACL